MEREERVYARNATVEGWKMSSDAALPCMGHLRRHLVEEVRQCDGFRGQCLEKQTACALSVACTKYSITNHLSAMGVPDLACDLYKVHLIDTNFPSATLDLAVVHFNND